MIPPSDGLQYLLDRRAIEDVLTRYFRGLDRGEPQTVRSCFTDDVVARYDGRTAFRTGADAPVVGVDALLDGLITFKRQASGDWKVSTHLTGQINLLALAGDEARTETYAIAFVVQRNAPADVVAQRALRYVDRLRRTADGWRIAERLHTLDWSSEQTALFATTMSERFHGPRSSGEPT